MRKGRPAACLKLLETHLQDPDCAKQTLMAKIASGRLAECSPGNAALDGVAVRIAGYAHPVDFEFAGVRSFLLAPPLRTDCRHPPPPLPDQVIAVEYEAGIDVSADPVWVEGILQRGREPRAMSPRRATGWRLPASRPP